jgi:glycosyltransferase involved in cell wall biosynthesis
MKSSESQQAGQSISAFDALPETAVAEAVSARRIKVMQVTWSLVAGGAEIYAFTIARNLAAERYTTELCALDQGGALEDEIKRQGIPYRVMNRRQGIDLRLIWRLYRLFAKTRPRIIQTHHFNQLFYSFIGARLVGARLVHTEHSLEDYEGRRKMRIALRLLSIFCRKVIAIGDDSESFMREQVGIPEKKLTVIRAGIDLKAFNESKREARAALGLGATERVVTIIARLYPEKNHKLLLAAFAEVCKQVTDARLLIVGEGIEREAIQAEITRLELKERVRMLGVRRDVAKILAATDVFALSSDREGLPIVALEAMAASRPVVSTAVGDLPLVINDRETGYLVPPNDAHALASALIELLNDESLATRIGEAARASVQPFGLETMISRYQNLYEAIL